MSQVEELAEDFWRWYVAHTTDLLGVGPEEVVFLDDQPGHVDAARAAGWHAVVHTDAARSIAEVERIIGHAD